MSETRGFLSTGKQYLFRNLKFHLFALKNYLTVILLRFPLILTANDIINSQIRITYSNLFLYFRVFIMLFGWILLNSTTERFLSTIFAANILPFLSIASFMVHTIVCIIRECHSTGFYALQYAAMGQIFRYTKYLFITIPFTVFLFS